MTAESRPVTVETSDGIAVIRLAGPRGNAINAAMVESLMHAFDRVGADDGVGGVLLASGLKLFCPGLDLQELAGHGRQQMKMFMSRFHACARKMYTFPKPVVAALSGHTLAGGFLLAISADWRVLMEGARVGLNELMVGVPIPYGLSIMLREEMVGPRLEEVALFGRNFEGEEAVAAGMVHESHGIERFEEHCLERLRELVSREPAAFSITKKYLRAPTVDRVLADDARLLDEFLDCWFLDATQERIHQIADRLKK